MDIRSFFSPSGKTAKQGASKVENKRGKDSMVKSLSKQDKQWIMKHLREKVICVIREFDFRGDGEKICPYHSP